jgi:hypothetical protein
LLVLKLARLYVDDRESFELGDPVDRASELEGMMNDYLLEISDLYGSFPQKSPVVAYISYVSAVFYILGYNNASIDQFCDLVYRLPTLSESLGEKPGLYDPDLLN